MFPIMTKSVNQVLNAAVQRLLQPLVALLLRHGMAYGTFAELARKVYVEQGFALVASSGKRPTISSVSALTGLTRKEAKRLRELVLIDDESSSQRYNRAIRVVSGWASDPRFLTDSGDPAILPMEGAQASFSALVKEFSGDIPPAAMLSVLQDSGTVAPVANGIALLQKAYIPSATPLEKLNILGRDVSELIDTIGHNLVSPPGDRHFQRKVSNVLVHPDAVPAFRELSARKSQLLLEEYHSWLSGHEVAADHDPALEPCYVAVGIYYSEYTGPGQE
jgi:hypothetical protein